MSTAYNLPTSDFVTTTLNGALTSGATTATVASGLAIPATNGILQIDYDSLLGLGVTSGPETVSYSSYNSGTGALTGLTRGVAGTTGVAHNNAANVQSGMSLVYLNQDLAAIIQQTAFTNWTPTWTNLVINNGTLVYAKYMQIGKLVHARLRLTLGSSSTVGGDISFTTPTSLKSDYVTSLTPIAGDVTLYDSAVGVIPAFLICANSTTVKIHLSQSNGTYVDNTQTSSTVPFTWASGGATYEIYAEFWYEGA